MANEVKHTPGPWKAEKDERNGVWYVCANPAERMADMLSEPNARLIAAAPELLDTLEAVVSVLESSLIHKAVPIQYAEAKAAIAKAKGGA